ncbi:hypothetical protein BANRA_00508 [Acinetobacter baumannii]|nr:hypothetical protein BANRA_00508 [Acinetobacter baumannii]
MNQDFDPGKLLPGMNQDFDPGKLLPGVNQDFDPGKLLPGVNQDFDPGKLLPGMNQDFDAHVLKFKMQFFPIKLFIFIAMFFFTTGMLFASFLSVFKCYF